MMTDNYDDNQLYEYSELYQKHQVELEHDVRLLPQCSRCKKPLGLCECSFRNEINRILTLTPKLIVYCIECKEWGEQKEELIEKYEENQMKEKYRDLETLIYHTFDQMSPDARREMIGKLVERYPPSITKYIIAPTGDGKIEELKVKLDKMWNEQPGINFFVNLPTNCGHDCEYVKEDGIISCCVCVDNTAWCEKCLNKEEDP